MIPHLQRMNRHMGLEEEVADAERGSSQKYGGLALDLRKNLDPDNGKQA